MAVAVGVRVAVGVAVGVGVKVAGTAVTVADGDASMTTVGGVVSRGSVGVGVLHAPRINPKIDSTKYRNRTAGV